MHIDRNPYTRMRIEQLLVCCIIVVCCHCCADYNKHYLIRSVTTHVSEEQQLELIA